MTELKSCPFCGGDELDIDTTKFTKYAEYYGPNDHATGIKCLRGDAPKEAYDEYIKWLKDRNRITE